jgi:hypothetical protein
MSGKRKLSPKQIAGLQKGMQRKGMPGHNPTGKNNPELTAIRKLTAHELKEIGSLLIRQDANKLRKIAKDGKESGLRAMVAAIAVKAIDQGDNQRAEWLANRIIGKVKDEIEVTGDHLAAATVVILPPKNE